MPFRVTIEEVLSHPDGVTPALMREVLRMTVETMNLPAVISAVNQKPRKPRTPKAVA